jgi:hypothetical protein
MDPFIPTISHLLLLKSLTELHLTINKCEPKVALTTLQPLATVLTWLTLNIGSVDESIEDTKGSTIDNDKMNTSNTNGYRIISYLLPFRSLTHLCISFHSPLKCCLMEVTGSFIQQHWNKLARFRFYGTTMELVPLFREFLSLSLSSSTPSAAASSIEHRCEW